MTWVDIVIIVVALLGAYIGFKHGLIRTLFTVAGLLAGVAIAGYFSDGLAEKLSPSEAQWASIISFILILLIVVVIANVVGKVVRMFFKVMLMGWLDALGGIVFGLLVGALVVAAILTVVLKWQTGESGGAESSIVEAISDSPLAALLIDNFRLLLGLLPGEFDEAVGKVFG